MGLAEQFTQDIIKILHNSKNSIVKDVSKWSKEYTRGDFDKLAFETSAESLIYESRKKYDQDENPSIFGNQPVSEYAQQPLPTNADEGGDLEDEEPKDEQEEEERIKEAAHHPEHQLTEEQRDALATEQRKREIEKHRSNFDGMPRNQR